MHFSIDYKLFVYVQFLLNKILKKIISKTQIKVQKEHYLGF